MLYKSRLIGAGYYTPEKVVTNNDLARYLDTSDEWIQKKIGVKERRIVADDEVASDMATKAAEMALRNAEIQAKNIDMIILATNTPDHISPATALQVQDKIAAQKAFAFDIRVGGCPGLVYGLSIASKYISDGTCKIVLVVTTDINSRCIDWNDRLTAVIMGDGASAVVLKSTSHKQDRGGIIDTQLYTDPSGYYSAYIPAGGTAEPITLKSLQEKRQYFKMDGKEIFKFATKVFPEAVNKIVSDNNLILEDIDFLIPHQANINIIKESMKKLNLPMEKTYCNINKYGNTGGSSVGIALAEVIEQELVKKGDKLVLIAYGAGLCWGTVLLEL